MHDISGKYPAFDRRNCLKHRSCRSFSELINKAFANNGACTLLISVKVLDNDRHGVIVVAASPMDPPRSRLGSAKSRSGEWAAELVEKGRGGKIYGGGR